MEKDVENNLHLIKLEETGFSHLTNLWLSGTDVCKILRISNRTLQNYRDRNILPFSQIGRKIYYKGTDINKYLEIHYIKSNFQKGGLV